jgi:transcriptional regulator with XRE-family HTH domain
MRESILEIAGYDRHDPASASALADAEKFARLLDELVKHRKDADLSQTAVAEKMGTKQSAVSELERTGANPRVRTLLRYARAVGMDLQFRASSLPLSGPYKAPSAVTSATPLSDRFVGSVPSRQVGKVAC